MLQGDNDIDGDGDDYDDDDKDRDILESSTCDRLNSSRGRPHNNSISHFDSPAPRLGVVQQTSLWKNLLYLLFLCNIAVMNNKQLTELYDLKLQELHWKAVAAYNEKLSLVSMFL